MVVIHAAWDGGRLVLWAEQTSGAEPVVSRAEVRPHPFAVPASVLAAELPRWGDAAAEAAGKAVAGDAVLLLPSSATSPLPLRRRACGSPRAARGSARGGCPRCWSSRGPRWAC